MCGVYAYAPVGRRRKFGICVFRPDNYKDQLWPSQRFTVRELLRFQHSVDILIENTSEDVTLLDLLLVLCVAISSRMFLPDQR